MAAFLDACRFSPTAGSTTDWTYSSAVTGYQSPALAGVVNGQAYKYRAESADLSQWEMGEGTYNTGTGVLTRATVLFNSSGTGTAAGQSGAGTKINFTSAPQVAIVALKEDLLAIQDAVPVPGGRLTLNSNQPVMQSGITGASQIFYDTFINNTVWIFNGSNFVPYVIAGDEISMVLAAANALSGKIYDIWGVVSAGALVIGIGPAWASTSSIGTGAGTSERQFKNGVRTNKNSLTHVFGGVAGTTDYGPVSANQATLLGSVYCTAAGQTGMNMVPGAALGGINNILGLSNAYNRVPHKAVSQDSTSTWTYASTTWRQANNSGGNQINFLDCIGASSVRALYSVAVQTSTTSGANIGLTRGGISAPSVQAITFESGGVAGNTCATVSNVFLPQLGFQTIQAAENSFDTSTQKFFGSGWGGSSGQVQSLIVEMDM